MVSTFLNQKDRNKFGPFLGVFTPSVLTILGVIMYLRFGWVVAHAGLLGSVAIVLICTMIALITSLSASAVATNSPLGTGGEYYMISRSLGLTIGGAIGIPLFLCYVLSITRCIASALQRHWRRLGLTSASVDSRRFACPYHRHSSQKRPSHLNTSGPLNDPRRIINTCHDHRRT